MEDIFKDRESIMKQWDKWRQYIAEGGGGSWPRDAFESLLDYYDEKLMASQPRPAVEADRRSRCTVCGKEIILVCKLCGKQPRSTTTAA